MANPAWFENLKVSLFNHYGKAPAKMLIHTGVIGWIMSSAAQIFAIAINDKIPKKEKMFMIPQEAADAMINILSFYTITQGVTSLMAKAVKCGKITPKIIKELGFGKKLGQFSFNMPKSLPKNVKTDFASFQNGMGVLATLVGSIISCNIVTPILRNMYASHKQQTQLAKMQKGTTQVSVNPYPAQKTTVDKKNPYAQMPAMQAFINHGSLKI
ncbi:MAG TPA: hypothetical protein DEO94_00590 [Cyanobacteria bacterium UBA11991]|nr:hypothetical protein [Cyanobacteriota bacterium]MDY6357929.1 hypothetical protein [Cyanobacteriota bacterium]HCB10663.1 hypothetical protein [Cyanobacteria bacterium UBA11991]